VAWARTEVVSRLLERGANVSIQNKDGWSPLHWAASHGGVAMIDVLILHGADPNLADASGRKPIDVARQYGKGPHVAKLKTVMARKSRAQARK
jgi:ankyrin repeat protein